MKLKLSQTTPIVAVVLLVLVMVAHLTGHGDLDPFAVKHPW